jgi:hypothetical protein
MNTRALLVVGAFLALPGWSQEPAADTSPAAPPTFDLRSDSVKKVLRDTAATQYASVQVLETKPTEPKPVKTVQFVPPEKQPARRATKINLPTWQKVEDSTFASWLVDQVFESIVEGVFDIEHDDSLELSRVGWVECQASIDLKRETLGNGSCNN